MHAGGGVCAARAAGRAAVTPRPRQAPAVRAGCTAKAGAHTRRWVRRRAAVHGAPAACPASWLHPWVQGRDTTIPYPTLHPCWHALLARSGLCCASRRRRRCSCIRIRRPAVWPPRPALQPRVSAVTRYLKPRILNVPSNVSRLGVVSHDTIAGCCRSWRSGNREGKECHNATWKGTACILLHAHPSFFCQ